MFLSGCQLADKVKPNDESCTFQDTRLMLNTVIHIQAYGLQAEQAVLAAFAEIQDLEPTFDQYSDTSFISKINYHFSQDKAISTQEFKITNELAELIQLSNHYSELTNGAFDISIGPLTNLWQVKEVQDVLPSQKELEQAGKSVDYKKIKLDHDKMTLKMEKGMALDLGALAKGYLVDQAMKQLTQYQVDGAIINAGGNIMTWGDNPQGPWEIGIADPLNPDQLLTTLIFHGSKSVVSAGNHERGYKIGGQHYGHIIDVATGFPGNKVLGTTIIGNHSLDADILSTATYLLGVEQGLKLMQEAGHEGLIIDQTGKIHESTGLELYCKELGKDRKL